MEARATVTESTTFNRRSLMGLTTLTEREKHWNSVARRATEQNESWESCADCLRFHPVGYEGSCDDLDNRLPGDPSEFLG
jgi:hypothetical protein